MEVTRLGNIYGENKGTGFAGNVWDKNGLSPTITTMQGGMREPLIIEENNTLTSVQKDNVAMETVRIKQATEKGYIECEVGGVADLSYPTSTTRRGKVQDMGRVSPTLTATETGVCKIESEYRIRKLTPKECWRLMAFTDEDFHKAEAVNSNTQLYKQAGNSIVVTVLEALFRQLNIQGVSTWDEIIDR